MRNPDKLDKLLHLEGLSSEDLRAHVEAVLFMSDKPLSLEKMRNLIHPELSLDLLNQTLDLLREEYEKGHHGFSLVEVAHGYEWRTKAAFSHFGKALQGDRRPLTSGALEVLAIVAYRGPVPKTEVDRIRGVDSSHLIRGLMERKLVRSKGRSLELGRSMLLETTSEFLELFNLPSLDALPPEHELEEMSSALQKPSPNVKNLLSSHETSLGENLSSYSEIKEFQNLEKAIKGVSTDTPFTLSLKSKEKEESAFNLLEKHLAYKLVAQSNLEAAQSVTFSDVREARIVSDLEGTAPLNPPDIEEGEDFQMLDLNTGLPLSKDTS